MSTTSSEKEIKKEVNEPQVENQQPKKESFFKRHKKKILAGACAVIGIAAGAYIYARNSKKADAPVKETAESKEEAQINEQPQRERGDRDDRRNNRHGGNRQNW